MAEITIRNVEKSYGSTKIIHGVSIDINDGELIVIVGPSGCGKSTLLRCIAGEITANAGEIQLSSGVRVARLEQDVPQGQTGSVFEVVAAGLGPAAERVKEYHALVAAIADDPSKLSALERCQEALEAEGGWDITQRVDTVLARLGLDGDAPVNSLSGGVRRRVLLACALVSDPDVLLLDEPTNHLDITAIEWLEEFQNGIPDIDL